MVPVHSAGGAQGYHGIGNTVFTVVSRLTLADLTLLQSYSWFLQQLRLKNCAGYRRHKCNPPRDLLKTAAFADNPARLDANEPSV